MLDATGSKMPADLKSGMEKTVTSKADVISWLKRSLEAVKQAHASETPADMQRKTRFFNTDGRWYLSANHCSQQRAHGTARCVCADDWRRAAVVTLI